MSPRRFMRLAFRLVLRAPIFVLLGTLLVWSLEPRRPVDALAMGVLITVVALVAVLAWALVMLLIGQLLERLQRRWSQ